MKPTGFEPMKQSAAAHNLLMASFDVRGAAGTQWAKPGPFQRDYDTSQELRAAIVRARARYVSARDDFMQSVPGIEAGVVDAIMLGSSLDDFLPSEASK